MDSTKYGWELDHLNILVPRTVPFGSMSAPPDIIYYSSFTATARPPVCRTEHVASRKLGALSFVCVRVWKPVNNLLTRSQTENESEKTFGDPDDDDM